MRLFNFSLFLCASLLLFFSFCLRADHPSEEISLYLRSPLYENGNLSTEEGGVILLPGMRIQARKIAYARQILAGQNASSVEAEGDLLLEIGEYAFVGKKLTYDFQKKTGVIYEGRTAVEPWFFGGKQIELHSDGSYLIHEGFITSSENRIPDWDILSEETTLSRSSLLKAKNVRFRIFRAPLLWIPSFKVNLNSIFDSPLRYTMQWGGKQRTRFGVIYEAFSWSRLKTFIRIDYRIKRGLGGGIETSYSSPNKKEYFETINYFAKDSSIDNPHRKTRYRFQGIYWNEWHEGKTSLDISYDKLSDKDMATDYNDRGLELDTAERTQIRLRRQNLRWIFNFLIRARLNSFQTVKQELPSLQGNQKPFTLADTGIIVENQAKASYLDFAYAKRLCHARDFHSARIEFCQKIYRPFSFSPLTLTPEASATEIYYSNSPQGSSRFLAIGSLALEARASLYRLYPRYKHIIQPYARYEYFYAPTVPPDKRYIFDIGDGWHRLNALRFGFSQRFYEKTVDGCLQSFLFADLFSYAFFDTPTLPQVIPKIYSVLTWQPFSILKQSSEFQWDTARNQLARFNFRTEWTVNENLAIATEYRHRSKFDWRKVDPYNFMLESFRTAEELRRSPLSDRRDTLLLHIFCRFHPQWAIEFESRRGWNRRKEPSYQEYEVDFLGSLPSSLNIKIAYQHKENEGHDHRIAFYFFIGAKRPEICRAKVPCIEF